MKVLNWLLGDEDEAVPPRLEAGPQPTAIERVTFRVKYDPQLVSRLKADHARLLGLLVGARAAVESDVPGQFVILLRELRLEMQGHLLVENVRFYSYLRQVADEGIDGEVMRLAPRLKHEMSGYVRSVNRFVDRYVTMKMDARAIELFRVEIDALSELLARRFEVEETQLYPSYQDYAGAK